MTTPLNTSILSLLGGLGGLNQQPQQPPTQAQIQNLQAYGTELRDRKLPDKNFYHWTQGLGTILQNMGGLHTLNKTYNMINQPRQAAVDALPTPPTTP